MKLKSLFTICMLAIGLGLAACEDDARIASRNLSQAADMFEISRRTYISFIWPLYWAYRGSWLATR